ncbi:MAG: carbamoyl transferase [Gammaproteobacteria bacterium]|nr:carbamoyl transferase [Gammaproteobacteria bacterium]
MYLLSMYTNMPSSVSLFDGKEVLAATHEERFTRRKNDEVFPERSIDYCLSRAGISTSELDGVAIASYIAPFDDTICHRSQWTVEDYLREQHERWRPYLVERTSELKSLLDIFPEKIDLNMYPAAYWRENYKKSDRNEHYPEDRVKIVANYLGIDVSKVHRIDHHRCHAAYSYYASPFRGEKILALTVDGWGDGMNATIGVFDEDGKYERYYATDQCSIARFYRYMTLVLGMKPNEHEYKLMGLAPYGREKYAKKALEVFRRTLYVDGTEFKWNEKPTDSYFWFRERLEGVRFDNIAWALQSWVEELLLEWVRNCIATYGIRKLVISGGVAMNIKAMGRIAAMPEVENLFVGGSASDESMAISAGICLAEDMIRAEGKSWDSRSVYSLPHLYLGPEASFEDEESVLKILDKDKYIVERDFTPRRIASLLKDGKILARCAGRMEFGQRALCNRSILADPSSLRVKEKINAAIKSRDFWMPFAPVVMDKYVHKYLINPKSLESPHMTIGFETTDEGYDAMIAACHPADRTARAQILHRETNPMVYEILEAFESLTGRGALLNTSFNLHGYPIVNTPAEALDVLERSDLDGLILNHALIMKV